MGHLVKGFGHVVPAVALDARAQAEAIVATARRQAAELIEAARAEAEALRAAARREGEGTGRAEAEAAFTGLLVAARADAERVRAEAVPSARALAARMAEKIIGRAVDLDPSALEAIVAQAVVAARARAGALVVRVHPDDLAALETRRPALAARLAKAVELRLCADATVDRSGCVVESRAGRLDARLATQLAALERAVFGGGTTVGDDADDANAKKTDGHV